MKITYKNLFIFIYTFFILLSLNVNPNNFFSTSLDQKVKILNIFRFFFPTLLLIIFIILKKLKLFKSLKSQNSIISKLIALFFLFLLLFSLINNFFIPENLYFILYLNIFAYTYILSNYYNNKIFLKVIIYILFIYFIYWILNIAADIFYKKYSFNNILFNLRILEPHQLNYNYFLGNSNLNSNGVARVLSILFLIIFSYQIFYKKNYINYIFLFSLIILLYSLQSRFAFYSLFFLSLLLIFINNKKKIIGIFIIILIFMTPVLLNKAFNNKFTYKKTDKDINQIENRYFQEFNYIIGNDRLLKKDSNLPTYYESENLINSLHKLGLSQNSIIVLTALNKITTGRVEIWFNYVIFKNQTNYFFGLGILSDKILFSTSISNALLYAYFTTGMWGSFIYLFVFTLLLIHFIKYIIYNKSYKLKITFYVVAIFLLLRSIVESGFLLYGLDLILILICLEAVNNQQNKLNFFKFNFFRFEKNIKKVINEKSIK